MADAAAAATLRRLPVVGDRDEETGEGDGCSCAAVPPCLARPRAAASAVDRPIHRHYRSPALDDRCRDSSIFVPVYFPPAPRSSLLSPGVRDAAPGSTSMSGSGERAEFAPDLLFDPSTPRCGNVEELDPSQDVFRLSRFGASVDEAEMDADGHLVGRGKRLGFSVKELWDDAEGDVAGRDLEEESSDWADVFLVSGRNVSFDSRCVEGDRLNGFSGSRSVSDSHDANSGSGIAQNYPHSDESYVSDVIEDLGQPLCWDCLWVDEERGEVNGDSDWEEVGEGGDFCTPTSVGQDGPMVQRQTDANMEMGEGEGAVRDIEWEVLYTPDDLRTSVEVEQGNPESHFGEEQDGFIYTSEQDILVGQFANDGSPIKGNPPASELVVGCLPSVVLAKVDSANNDSVCAVCKDEISAEEEAKQLPCSHHYHADCILSWLRMRNTCPICRYELPTDDPEYENWRVQRACRGGLVWNSRVSQVSGLP